MTTTRDKIRVLLVDDHHVVLDGLQARLGVESGIEVVGKANNGEEALEQVDSMNPDVVLMDVNMPVLNGFDATCKIREAYPRTRVLILSMHNDRQYILRMMQSGASGYVLKEVSSEELVKAIETVYQGNTYFSQSASQSLFKRADSLDTEVPDLTRREKTVLKLLAQGKSNKEIAAELSISVRTVETHRQNIKSKLEISTSAGLVRYAIENKLV